MAQEPKSTHWETQQILARSWSLWFAQGLKRQLKINSLRSWAMLTQVADLRLVGNCETCLAFALTIEGTVSSENSVAIGVCGQPV